jgi:hypothetical protein
MNRRALLVFGLLALALSARGADRLDLAWPTPSSAWAD